MTHNYTSNQIIKYLYRDQSITDYLETEYAISNNPEWKKSYVFLKEAFTTLPKVKFFPSGKVIRSILKYSATP